MTTINKRVTYSYFDYNKGLLEGYIDVDLKQDDEGEIIHPRLCELKNMVSRKWKNSKYTNGDIHSVEVKHLS